MSIHAQTGPVTAGLGWLDGSAPTAAPQEVLSVLESRFGSGVDVPGTGGFYGKGRTFGQGIARADWDGYGSNASTTRAEVKQSGLDLLGLAGSVELLRDLTTAGFRASRADFWLNDRERRMTPAKVREAVLGGQAVTHARPGRWWHDDLTGRSTYYLGRADSDRMARCYDREDDQARMELQSRRAMAKHGVGVLMTAEVPALAIASNVIAFVDFRQSKGRVNGARAPRLDWWDAVVADAGRAAAAPPIPRRTLEELGEVFRQQWARGLAELVRGLGTDWLDDVLSEGFDKLAEQEVTAA